jgi:multiple sugar transport system substrate-binding protein
LTIESPETQEDLMSDDDTQQFDLSELGDRPMTRRGLLAAAGVGGLAAMYGVGAARAGAALPAALRETLGGTVTLGSYETGPGIKALAAASKKFTSNTGIGVKINTVDHNTFQNQINSYLQGRPDDAFTWFAGYRMQFFAAKGLATQLDDVWEALTPQMPPAVKAASTGLDGHQYLVPNKNYPWAVYYRKSLWKKNGYTAPKTWDQYIALAKKMKTDGLTPIAFTDKDGWPAMGTFDIINMRINGYQFHVDLMAGKEAWDGPQVKAVFNQWAELMPYYSAGALGLTWQDGATQLENNQAGMFLLGGFVTSNFKPANQPDIDFFPFPEINAKWGQDSIDAPIDGYMLSKKPKNLDGAKKLVGYFGTAQAIDIYNPLNPGNLAVNIHADKSKYTPLQKKEAALIASTKHIAQYMDRDTRPDFASTVMIPSLQTFLNKPSDVTGLVKSIQKQKKAIFGS